ncbi:uncharacterized protein LOC135086525 isoform X1 [Ostrinia nubilalis]|uniref:uncharacterized protein LOC135086525 isoform X1 n=1 Tax=Ostrinia nubilalis TaxID=29057 RepID=UPI0030823894
MIRQVTFSIALLLLSCAAQEQGAENTTTTTKENNNITQQTSTENGPKLIEQNISELDPVIERSSHFHHHIPEAYYHHHQPTYHGFWKKKFVWRPRWVKTWQEKKVYVAVWKRMWGPAMLNEWVPIPKPPPGWVKHGVGSFVVQTHPH